MFKSSHYVYKFKCRRSSTEKNKLVKTKAPIYTGLPHSNTVLSVHKKTMLQVKLCSNELI